MPKENVVSVRRKAENIQLEDLTADGQDQSVLFKALVSEIVQLRAQINSLAASKSADSLPEPKKTDSQLEGKKTARKARRRFSASMLWSIFD